MEPVSVGAYQEYLWADFTFLLRDPGIGITFIHLIKAVEIIEQGRKYI